LLGCLCALPAAAQENPCAFEGTPIACEGITGTAELAAVIAKFSHSCPAQKKSVEGRDLLKFQCPSEQAEFDTVKKCAEEWSKTGRNLRGIAAAVLAEKAAAEKIQIGASDSCAAAVAENSALLKNLNERYSSLVPAAQESAKMAQAEIDRFHKAYGLLLLALENTDPQKKYLGIKGEPGLPPPAAKDLLSNGVSELVTSYRLPLEIHYPGVKDTVVKVGKTEIKVTAAFAKQLQLQGTAVLADGRMVNAAGGGTYAFVRIVSAPYGVGAFHRAPLEPFRSIAVSPKVIPLGSLVYIHEARGMPLPMGGSGVPEFHDGYFRAIDVGSMINGTHIDIFSGPELEDFKVIRNWFYKKSVHYFVVK
jgi:3D (Asp-Asp-Asp) domain-containing protein